MNRKNTFILISCLILLSLMAKKMYCSREPVNDNEQKLNIAWINTDKWPEFDGWCESFMKVTNLDQSVYPQNYDYNRNFMEHHLDQVLRKKGMVGKLVGNIGMLPFKPQQIMYFLLASTAQTICEVGFNAGHSTFQFLMGNTNATIYSFDLGIIPYSKDMAQFLIESYGKRLHVIWGNSQTTVPSFSRNHPHIKCDLIVIDGGHSYNAVLADIKNLGKIARENNFLVMDDTHQIGRVNKAYKEAVQEGFIKDIFSCSHKNDIDNYKRFSIGRYIKKG